VKRTKQQPKQPRSQPKGYTAHTLNVPAPLEARIARCMALESLQVFTDFANSALARKCRDIEHAHGIDAEGRKL
jgi:hypothetical protein